MMAEARRSTCGPVGISWKRVALIVLIVLALSTLGGLGWLRWVVIPSRTVNGQWVDPSEIRVSLSGVVRDATGNPEPNATLYVARHRKGLVLEAGTVADASGRYLFSGLVGYDPDHPLRQRNGLPIWSYWVFAQAAGQGFGHIYRLATRDIEDADIQLHPEHRVSGKVTDVTGYPLEGAMISLRRIEVLDATGTPHEGHFYSPAPERLPPPLFTLTDKNGGFVLPGLPGGRGIWLEVEAPGYFEASAENVSEGDDLSFAIELVLSLVGRVAIADNRPPLVAAEKVRLVRLGAGEERLARLNERGFFRVDRMRAGHYEVSLLSDRYEADPVRVHLTRASSRRPVVIHARQRVD